MAVSNLRSDAAMFIGVSLKADGGMGYFANFFAVLGPRFSM